MQPSPVTHERSIWQAGVDAVRPLSLLQSFLESHPEFRDAIRLAPRIVIVGGGKAGSAMAEAFETLFPDELHKIEGFVNVPANAVRSLKKIQLHVGRPAETNHPTSEGVIGSERMLQLVSSCGPEDLAIVLLSGGGSALLPAPAEGISLPDKQALTQHLHRCGATIGEMNCIRKHLSRIKGGGLLQAFRGKKMISLIISDVVGDPLDVIASGPTSADPSTFQDALAVLKKYDLIDQVPSPILNHLQSGIRGELPETLKELPANIENVILGNNQLALFAAKIKAADLGYRVLNLGSFIEGETHEVARTVSGIVRSILRDGTPIAPPCCVLIGGETTVTLPDKHGKGGRNQEFVLSMLSLLSAEEWKKVRVLSGGTDGEDGPTDAAGATADGTTLSRAASLGLSLQKYFQEHNAYRFFDQLDGLIRTGLTETNVMDLRVILITS